jgi:hypothetical protein
MENTALDVTPDKGMAKSENVLPSAPSDNKHREGNGNEHRLQHTPTL